MRGPGCDRAAALEGAEAPEGAEVPDRVGASDRVGAVYAVARATLAEFFDGVVLGKTRRCAFRWMF